MLLHHRQQRYNLIVELAHFLKDSTRSTFDVLHLVLWWWWWVLGMGGCGWWWWVVFGVTRGGGCSTTTEEWCRRVWTVSWCPNGDDEVGESEEQRAIVGTLLSRTKRQL